MACERAKVRARVVEPNVSRSLRIVRSLEVGSERRQALARRGSGPEAQLLEPRSELVQGAAHARRQHSEVGAADREHAAVEVLTLALQ